MLNLLNGTPRHFDRCATSLTLSQVQFAALLGVSPESYRTWDAGRRPVPPTVLAKAEQFARASSGGAWAQLFGIHVRTLRQAAHDGRLDVTYGSHVFFGHAVPLASCVAVQRFQERYYRQTTRWNRPTLHSHVRRACAGGGQVWGRRAATVRKEVLIVPPSIED